MIKNYFVWDLGATKCSAGIVEHNVKTNELYCKKKCSIKLANTSSLEDLIHQLEQQLDFFMTQADAICIGAAGHYDGESLLLEGVYPYPMPFASIAKLQKWPCYTVIHDYAPIVCATFTDYMDNANNVFRLNTCPINHAGRRVAFGLGTGLGGKDGVLFPDGNFWLGQNEMGHIGITHPPASEVFYSNRHSELIRFLQNTQDHQAITFEKVLSGPGLARLFQFFYPSQGILTPEEVGYKIQQGQAPEILDTVAWYLGLFVGTLQLMFMPEGGIWITGGVALNHLNVFNHPDFFVGIKTSPAYLLQRQEFPLGVLCNLEHALIGSAYYASKKLIHTYSDLTVPGLSC